MGADRNTAPERAELSRVDSARASPQPASMMRRNLAWLACAIGCASTAAESAPSDVSLGVDVGPDLGAEVGSVALDAGVDVSVELPAPPKYPNDGVLRLNQLQHRATHNSYHVAPEGAAPGGPWTYTHLPLDQQLATQGVRAFELDVTDEGPGEEGLRVYHVAILDDRTVCDTLAACLKQIRTWSDAHRDHAPIVVQIEPKNAIGKGGQGLLRLDASILAVFGADRLVRPPDVQKSAPTLREAVLTGTAWPTLGEARGKLVFALNGSDETNRGYVKAHASRADLVVFPYLDPPDPDAAFVIRNDAPAAAKEITALVTQGFIVRTRADTDGVEAVTNDRTVQQAALQSGAHLVSTDFPAKVPGTDYWLELPGGTPSRCNPVSAPPSCTSGDIERP